MKQSVTAKTSTSISAMHGINAAQIFSPTDRHRDLDLCVHHKTKEKYDTHTQRKQRRNSNNKQGIMREEIGVYRVIHC